MVHLGSSRDKCQKKIPGGPGHVKKMSSKCCQDIFWTFFTFKGLKPSTGGRQQSRRPPVDGLTPLKCQKNVLGHPGASPVQNVPKMSKT